MRNRMHHFYGSGVFPPCRWCGARYALEIANAACPQRERCDNCLHDRFDHDDKGCSFENERGLCTCNAFEEEMKPRGINDDPMTPGEIEADRRANADVIAPWETN